MSQNTNNDNGKKLSDSLLAEFIAESEEITQRVSANLSLIEHQQIEPEKLDSLYRDMHTFKGSAQLLGFKELGELGHAMETALDPLRRSRRMPSPRLLECFYRSLDLIEQMVKAIQNNQPLSSVGKLEVAIPALIEASLESYGKDFQIKKDTLVAKEELHIKTEEVKAPVHEPQVEIPTQVMLSEEVVPMSTQNSDKNPEVPPVTEQSSEHADTTKPAANNAASANESSTIRVPVSLLDKLMALMGEMVLVRNQVLQYSNNSDDLEFLNLSQRLDLVTSELQGEVMKTRMQPIGNVLTKFQRVVRDLSRELNKKLEMSLFGGETELDKTLLEAIKDPLTHIIRNCCDHGIESPADRKKAGKPEAGTIAVKAFHEGGQVIVEISDDGKGLHRDKLVAKALEKGLISSEKVGQMSERDVMNLIFAPGFSTAAKVTNVSGRGVGMDVVKNNIEKIGGQAEVESIPGKGMTVRLKIPLTLAIVPAMIIRTANDRYAIPQVKLVELVRVDSSSGNQIEYLQGQPMYRLRGDLLPLVNLKTVLGLKEDSGITTHQGTNIVVLKSEQQMFGLIVDEIQDTADIVVKPLSQFLKSLSIYSGATVLGDGSVALILDVIGLSQQAHLTSDKQKGVQEAATSSTGKFNDDSQELLFFTIGQPAKYAVPLNLVQRLEEFKSTAIELTGSQRVVRYRGSILPIIRLSECLGFPAKTANTAPVCSVIVVQKTGKLYGIEVDDILDVGYVTNAIDDSLSDRFGILGNVIFNQEVIVVVDILAVVDKEAKRLNRQEGNTTSSFSREVTDFNENRKAVKILFAEDTAFFRRHVKSVLDKAGFDVTVAFDGAEAWKKLEASEAGTFQIILSDIEMPKMSGLDLARQARKDRKWKETPMIALTTKFSDRHVKEGKEAGFNLYLEKMNPAQLVTELDKLMQNDGGAS